MAPASKGRTYVRLSSTLSTKVPCQYCNETFSTRGINRHEYSCLEKKARRDQFAELAAQAIEAQKKCASRHHCTYLLISNISFSYYHSVQRKEKRRLRKEREAVNAVPSPQLPVVGSPRFDSDVDQQIITSDNNAGSLGMDLEYSEAAGDTRQRMYTVDSIHFLSSMCHTRFRLGH